MDNQNMPRVTEQAGEHVQPFRERFADAYLSLSVAAFSSPFWSQSMEDLLTAIDAEIDKRVEDRVTRQAAPEAPTCAHVWNDFGQLGGRNVSWCPRCDTLAWTGREPGAAPAQAGDALDVELPAPREPHSNEPRDQAHAAGWNACLEAVRAAKAASHDTQGEKNV